MGGLLATIFTPEHLAALAALTALEIVLGIDNIVFIAVLTGRLPEERRAAAQKIGLLLALGTRIVLLFAIAWIMGLQSDLFSVVGHGISGRDLILVVGGLFLLGKATLEIHETIEAAGAAKDAASRKAAASFGAVLVQIALLDVVFSLDSVITAVGMVDAIPVMIAAIVIAMGVMIVFAGSISRFIERHPTMKMLALAFLVLVGVILVAESLDVHVPRGYIYFAMGFSLFVETLNLKLRRPRNPPPTPHLRP